MKAIEQYFPEMLFRLQANVLTLMCQILTAKVNFHCLRTTLHVRTKECLSIDFYRTKHTETYNFHVPTLVNSTFHKITAKKRYSLSKFNAFDKETTLRHTFLSSDLQCLPPSVPRILCA